MPLPKPFPGLVLSFSYLWRHEADAGESEGRKNRPVVIVTAVQEDENGRLVVTVAPITHQPPTEPHLGLELPPRVKAHLGLDAARSWISATDFNRFVWPGFDLGPLPGRPGEYAYGVLPPKLFKEFKARILEAWSAKKGRLTRR